MNVEIEPIPKDTLPKNLRNLPDALASHLYCYRTLSRGIARRIHTEYEESLRQGAQVSFSLHPATLFMLKAAAEGIIGNVAFAALVKVVNQIRKPKQEAFPSKRGFDQVVSHRKYSRYRQEVHPDDRPSRVVSVELERKIEEEYRLMVPRKKVVTTPNVARGRKKQP